MEKQMELSTTKLSLTIKNLKVSEEFSLEELDLHIESSTPTEAFTEFYKAVLPLLEGLNK